MLRFNRICFVLSNGNVDVDNILHHVWDKVTFGNFGDPKQDANAFVEKYSKFIFKPIDSLFGNTSINNIFLIIILFIHR